MKKLYNVIFPIWFIILMPPIILLVIPSNYIIDSLVLMLSFKLLKIKNWFNNYKKTIIKVWITGFLVDILGSILLLTTQFIPNNEFLYENLIYPLAWNPFMKPLSLIYCLLIVFICGFLIYLINYTISFKNTNLEDNNKRIISLLLGLITAPYLFLLPTSLLYNNMNNSLESYQNTNISEKKQIKKILSKLNKNYGNFEINDKKLIIYYKKGEFVKIEQAEEEALILYNLINDVNYIKIKNYEFDIDYINNIFDIKKTSITEIRERYESEYFDKFNYLGHINKYDLFDTSTSCSRNKTEIYKDEFTYFVECSDTDALYLVNGDYKIKLQTALEKKEINVEDLFKTDLKISKENNEINS